MIIIEMHIVKNKHTPVKVLSIYLMRYIDLRSHIKCFAWNVQTAGQFPWYMYCGRKNAELLAAYAKVYFALFTDL